MDDDAERDAPGAALGQLLGKHDRHPEVGTAAAVLRGVLHPEEPELAHAAEEGARYLFPLLPLLDLGGDLLLNEAAH